MDSIWEWFRWLNGETGINLAVFYDKFDRGRFASGFLMTAGLSAICVVLSVLIGIAGAWLQGSRLRAIRSIVHWYIQFFRNTPPLVQLYFFYFGIGSLLNSVDASGRAVPLISNVTWAIVSLSFFAGAFNVEIFRSGVEAVPKTTLEAAESLGFDQAKELVVTLIKSAIVSRGGRIENGEIIMPPGMIIEENLNVPPADPDEASRGDEVEGRAS